MIFSLLPAFFNKTSTESFIYAGTKAELVKHLENPMRKGFEHKWLNANELNISDISGPFLQIPDPEAKVELFSDGGGKFVETKITRNHWKNSSLFLLVFSSLFGLVGLFLVVDGIIHVNLYISLIGLMIFAAYVLINYVNKRTSDKKARKSSKRFEYI